jgi:hypothetical protein
LILTFYEGLTTQSRSAVDSAAGEALRVKP